MLTILILLCLLLICFMNLGLLVYYHNRYQQLPFGWRGAWIVLKVTPRVYKFTVFMIVVSHLIVTPVILLEIFDRSILKNSSVEMYSNFFGADNVNITLLFLSLCVIPPSLAFLNSFFVFCKYLFKSVLVEAIATYIESFRKKN